MYNSHWRAPAVAVVCFPTPPQTLVISTEATDSLIARCGETPYFVFALAVACSLFLVVILREAEDLLLSLLLPLPLSVPTLSTPNTSHLVPHQQIVMAYQFHPIS
jgi:hypothetical protein